MMEVIPIRILLVDDHAIVRHGYRALIEKQDVMEVVGEAADGEEAYRRFLECAPDVVILDLSLPGQSGLEVISRIRKRKSDARILVFTMHQIPAFAAQAFQAGAMGYVTKSSPPEVLLRAVTDVFQGRHALSADIAQALAIERLADPRLPLAELSVREFEVLRLLVDGRGTAEIADLLHISQKTVANHHYMIKRKLDVGTDIELMRLAIRLNVVDLLDLRAAP
jgi:DNA-binding NarL/FixJ family response regulator